MPSGCSISATSRCSGSTCGWLACSANLLRVQHRFLCLFRVFVDIHVRAFELLQRLEVCALFRRERPRQLHIDRRVQIAVIVRLANRRHAVPLQPEHLAVLRRRGNLQSHDLAAERPDLGLAAEHRRRERHGHLRVEIAPLALE